MKRILTAGLVFLSAGFAGADFVRDAGTDEPESLLRDDCRKIRVLPATLGLPGKYCLAADLSFTPSALTSPAILIQADYVHLDLRGFGITSTVPGWGQGVTSDGRRGTIVENGLFAGLYAGVQLDPDEACRVQGVTVTDASHLGIRVGGAGCLVRGNHLSKIVGRTDIGQNAVGIGLFGSSHTALDNDLSDIYGGAPSLTSLGIIGNACDRCVIEGNRLANALLEPANMGIYVGSSADVLVVGNRIVRWNYGLFLNTGKYRDNLTAGCATPYTGGTDAGNNQ